VAKSMMILSVVVYNILNTTSIFSDYPEEKV